MAIENVILDSVKRRLDNVNYSYLDVQPLDIALSYIDSTINADNQFFKKLVSGKKTKPVFIEYAKASIEYRHANLKLSILEGQKSVNGPNHYNFLNQITIENDNYLGLPYYRSFLDSYLSMKTNKSYDKLDSIRKSSPDALFDESLKVIWDLKNQNVREFSLANVINSRLTANGIKGFDKYYDYFKENNTNLSYSELIRKRYKKNNY